MGKKKTESSEAEKTATEEKPKRVVRRRSLWLCLPVTYETIAGDEGEEIIEPKTYEIWECRTKADLVKILHQKQIDTTNLNPSHAMVFRADALPLKLTTQVSIKF